MRSILMITAAAVALAGSAALAEPGGKDKGGGGPGKGGAHAQMKGGGGGNKGPDRAIKGGGNGKAQAKNDARPANKGPGNDRPKVNAAKADRGPDWNKGGNSGQKQAERKPDKQDRPNRAADARGPDKDRIIGSDRRVVNARVDRPTRADVRRVEYSGPQGRRIYVPTNDRVRVVTERTNFSWRDLDRRRYLDGCPPGLAKKNNGCMPPGLVRSRNYRWDEPNWYRDDWDRDYRYRYHDGYVLRLNNQNNVLGYVPLLGGALALGQVWPSAYAPVSLPNYYTDYFGLGSTNSYRYYNDAIFRLNPETSAITAIAALLTGNDIAVGQPMPLGYEVYNVPLAYRDQYFDGPEAYYRYSDGRIYQLDPTTRLVQAAIELLV